MASEITLDTALLNRTAMYSSSSEFKDILKVIEQNSHDKYGLMNQDSVDKSEQVSRMAPKFSAIYMATYSKIPEQLKMNRTQDKEIINILSCYSAAQAVLQMNSQNGETLENRLVSLISPTYEDLNFSHSDVTIIDSILNSYNDFITKNISNMNANAEINFFFDHLSRRMRGIAPRYSRYKELVEEFRVVSPQFRVHGMKKPAKKKGPAEEFMDGDDKFKTDFMYITINDRNRVDAADIIGNEAAKHESQSAIFKLMTYDPKLQLNYFMQSKGQRGFTQGLLFFGGTGTGKTLTAFYAMTLADKIASHYGKDLAIVQPKKETSWQEGGVLMLRHQLNEICKGEKTYVIFFDEIDTHFPSRTDSGTTQYHKQKLGELLQFMSGYYPNKGNYIIIGTANKPEDVDPALKNARFERIHCPGPLTAEEKGQVLALHFGKDLHNGIVQVKDWDRVGDAAFKEKINGREAQAIIGNIYKESEILTTTEYDQLWKGVPADTANSIISKGYSPITEKTIIKKIEEWGMKSEAEKEAMFEFYSQ